MKALIAICAAVVCLSVGMGRVALCEEGTTPSPTRTTSTGVVSYPSATEFGWAGPRENVSSRTVVVPAGEVGKGDFDAIVEDMNIMYRILDKTLSEQLGQDYASSPPGRLAAALGGSPGAQAIYLEGYGALFMLRVRFPLLPPPATETRSAEPEEESVWAETKRELYGQPGHVEVVGPFGREIQADRLELYYRYDAKKVENLKEALFGALKEASHVRKLKPEDSVVLVVSGGSAGYVAGSQVILTAPGGRHRPLPTSATPTPAAPSGPETLPGGGKGGGMGGGMGWGGMGPWTWTAPGGGQASVLTIRVKKSDVDAFAQGKLSFPEFQKRAKVFISADGETAAEGGAELRRPASSGG